MTTNDYVHGYSGREAERLSDQANCLVELLHGDTFYPAESKVMEAGCGVGAQTITIAAKSPHANFVSIDVSRESLSHAKTLIEKKGITNVEFQQADIFNLPFKEESFDHIFVCFVLEHLANPRDALVNLRRVLRTGGSITIIEGDHGSAYFHPDSEYARQAIQCLIDLQAQAGGNSIIGRQLYPLVTSCGFKNVHVSPRVVYADASRPEMVEDFTRKTFTAMVEGVERQVIGSNMVDPETWKKGINDLYRTAENDGTFNYTFFKAVGIK